MAVFPWLITAIAIVAVIVVMTPRTGVMQIGDEAWLNDSAGGDSGRQPLPLIEPPSLISRGEESAENPGQESDRAQPAADSHSALGIEPPRKSAASDVVSAAAVEPGPDASREPATASGNKSRLESLPPPVAYPEKAHASNSQAAGKSAATPGAATVAIKDATSISAEKQSRETLRKSGPWVINLVSVGNKDNAERFRAKAGTRGVATALHRVTIKGNDYWRVQVSGFATAAEAKAEADVIKKKLGLDAVWIVKR